MNWRPTLGATYSHAATRFRVWSPDSSNVSLILENGPAVPMVRDIEGYFAVTIPNLSPGDLYRFQPDGNGPFPDPASRFQPHGVHGPSAIVDPSAFSWTDSGFHGIGIDRLILYELHTGTFTPQGTFRAAAEKLPYLRELGVTAVELMPVADFAGDRNWGYDGVSPFAPARCYGTPDDLRHFVNTAHELNLAVFLDVVYNHFGPDGAYQGAYSPYYFSKTHRSLWGDGINVDGPGSSPVRDYFIENALRWVHEYHIDGLRLDATHAIVDESPRHILASIAASVRASLADSPRRVLVIAEDSRNIAAMMYPESEGGWELDGVWADDFHHQVRRCLAGDSEGYYQYFDGSAEGIARTAKQGWFRKGTDPSGLPYPSFVVCIQNHDQIGNRAFGDRLHHSVDLAAWHAASTLLLMLPETPLLFMGQEWAASSPFQYFTDHHAELGKLVTQGRRSEFRRFSSFSGEVPDPQALSTFEASRLNWEEAGQQPHASTLRLYRALLALRRTHPSLQTAGKSPELDIVACGSDAVLLRRDRLLVAVAFRGAPRVALPSAPWRVLLSTEDPQHAPDPAPPHYDFSASAVSFQRPGALILEHSQEDNR